MPINYDFIEVGTSDFHTLIENASNETIGLSIEPISEYLNRLPNKPLVKKVQAALSNYNGEIDIYHIELDVINQNHLPIWVRGCNSVNGPHHFTRNKIGNELYDSLVKIDKVPTITWEILVQQFDIGSIEYLKIDTEGHEHIILQEYYDICKKRPELFAKKIRFEYNETSNKTALDELISKFKNYNVSYLEEDVVLDIKPGLFYKHVKIADAGYIINLPHRTDRRESILNLLEKMNITGFQFVDGVIMENPEFKKLGCTQTYLNIFQSFLKSNLQNVLVFEDDLKLMNGVTESDLDNIFYNWEETSSRYDVVALGIKLLPRSKVIQNSDTDGSFKEMLCSQSLFYKRNYIEHYVSQMKNFLDPNHYLYKCTIDMFLNDSTNERYRFIHNENHKVYNFGITIPMVFTQTPSFSDNELENQNYDEIMETTFWNSVIFKKGYVYLANEKYFDIVESSCKSVREFSNLPIFVYLINCDRKIDVDNVKTIRWNVSIPSPDDTMFKEIGDNFYIDRTSSVIYKILIQRISAVRHSLENFVQTACYIDSDSVATPHVDKIFDFYDEDKDYPFFVEGIYDWMHYNGRGGAESMDDLSTTLEHPACELFNINQYVRKKYRQTGYFVAGQKSIEFLEEWYWYCTHPKVLKNTEWYAAYNEETIANVVLYKRKIFEGLPYVYVNGGLDIIDKMYTEVEFLGGEIRNHIGPWLRVPDYKHHLMFFHGEKDPKKMMEMTRKIKSYFYEQINPSQNWGDLISHKVIEHFSGKKLPKNKIFHFDPKAIVPFSDGKIMGVGSILAYTNVSDYVWGSGCIKEFEVGLPAKKYYAVRGPLTRNELLNVGRECPEVYGDPGLLFPKIYNPNIKKKYKYGIVPHFIDYEDNEIKILIEKLKDMGVKIINITSGIYEFINQLKEVEFVLSTSLHGIVESDAYRIPNCLVVLSGKINGGDFKYRDYFMSVKRDYEQPPNLTLSNFEELIPNLKYDLGDISIAETLLKNAPWSDPNCSLFNKNTSMKLLFVAPHLSTGGMPSFLLKQIELLKEYHPDIDIHVVEFQSYGDEYVVHRNKIKEILDSDKFFTLGEDKFELIKIIENNNIDIVHVHEMIEGFDSFNQMPTKLMSELYRSDRKWKMVETCHNVWFSPNDDKIFFPEGFAFCTPHHKEKTFSQIPCYGEVIEFPIENKKVSEEEKIQVRKELGFGKDKIHVLNVGLWTKGKNQGEGVEIAKLLRKTNPEIVFHFVGNQASNFKDYWFPIMKNLPQNVRVWGERSDIDKFMKAADVFMFNSTWECNPLVLREAASYGLKILSRNLPQYMDMFTPYITNIGETIYDSKDVLLSLIKSDVKYTPPIGQEKSFANSYFNFYKKVLEIPIKPQKFKTKFKVVQNFINQPFLEIQGKSENNFLIKFKDEKNIVHYENRVPINTWVRLNRQYYTKWTAEVWENDDLIYNNTLDYEGKRVYIALESKSLGDSVAWIPYTLEFQRKHNCTVIVSTFWNKLFESKYPELIFVEPGTEVHNIYGMYKLGWFDNPTMNPVQPKLVPLQQTASDILGMDFKEILPRINYTVKEKPYEGKYVAIATNSTAGCKFWTREGWQELINYLNSQGYKVVNISKENNPFENQIRLKDLSIENTMNVIHHSEFLIGLSSGLSWLAWGMGKHVVMISNFTTPDHEFQSNCTRIVNKSVCNGCWNNAEYIFDRGDWDWCPVHKGTDRQFECHKSITSQMVIDKIKNLIL